ncbi:MAG: T9SS type A sorting domain-containing protein [Bacteroidetes bacterium]|nr:T9SS type A sorting domain-containing protein [Bacteroidota bacterium]
MKKSLLLIGILMNVIAVGQNPVLNASFESWTLGEPDDWTTNNAPGFRVPIQQNNTGHTGNYALSGFVTQIGINTAYPPILSSTDMSGNPHPVSFAYTNMSFYYKLNLTGTGEFFNAGVVISDPAQQGIGGGVYQLYNAANTNTFTLANVPISYIPGGIPAGATITFAISDTLSGLGLQIGSYFRLDDVSLNFASGIDEAGNTDALLSPYPNPSHSIINLPFNLEGGNDYSLIIYDLSGKEVDRVNYSSMPKGAYKEVIDVSDFEAGAFFAVLKEGNILLGTKLFNVLK